MTVEVSVKHESESGLLVTGKPVRSVIDDRGHGSVKFYFENMSESIIKRDDQGFLPDVIRLSRDNDSSETILEYDGDENSDDRVTGIHSTESITEQYILYIMHSMLGDAFTTTENISYYADGEEHKDEIDIEIRVENADN
ncbi:hypothetical protein [Halosolutus gelatinilyticus]|uniref:hypothetical protein n=1 Tax=Halosolutus gelatinilyticus TaxID=2931975 RepID=UPI001FF12D22|nr:hypothetical protein [Halosolutus gelatinilyticus]